MNNIYLVTVATHSQGYFPILKESCKRQNAELIVLGYNEKWKGFAWRFELVRNFLKTLNGNDIVVFIDAFDVILLNNLSIIKERFIEKNTPILFSKDGDPGDPIFKYLARRVFPQCNNININAGCYMGYVNGLIMMFDRIYSINGSKINDDDDDQRLFISLCKDDFFKKNIKIDTEQNIFLNILPKHLLTTEILFTSKDGKILNKDGNEPCVIHAPGNGDLNEIAFMYGYELAEIQKFNFIQGAKDRAVLYTRYFHLELMIVTIVILFIISIFIFKRNK